MDALTAIIIVIVVLVTLLIALGVFVAILLLWTCKSRAGQSTTGGARSEVYETIDKIRDVFRRDKKKNNGVLTDPEGVYRRSYAEEEKVTLQEGLNSVSIGI